MSLLINTHQVYAFDRMIADICWFIRTKSKYLNATCLDWIKCQVMVWSRLLIVFLAVIFWYLNDPRLREMKNTITTVKPFIPNKSKLYEPKRIMIMIIFLHSFLLSNVSLFKYSESNFFYIIFIHIFLDFFFTFLTCASKE